MRVPLLLLTTALFGACTASAQQSTTWRFDDFATGDLSAWQKGVRLVDDADRGRVLRFDARFVDPKASEPAFLTRTLTPQPKRLDVLGVRFWARMTAPGLDPAGGFKVRLRTSDTAFTDFDVQEQLGRPFPVNEWVHVELDTLIGSQVRNIWGTVLSTVREITFRLDDIDSQNAELSLLLSDVELVLANPPATQAYLPTVHSRPAHEGTRVLLLKHRAAGYYHLEDALQQIDPAARVDTYYYRGLHFELFGFPTSLDQLLQYDLIVLLDVDPFIMTHEQCTWVADAVASGASLLVFAGPVTLTRAQDFRAPLTAVLPVTFESGAADVTVKALPSPGPPHPLNEGLDSAGLGIVSSVQSLKSRPGADVPWLAKDLPLVITAPIQKGRATVVNAWPQVDQTPEGGFFTASQSSDFLRRLLQFSLQRVPQPSLLSLTLPPLTVPGGTTVSFRAAAPEGADLRARLDDQADLARKPLTGGAVEFTLPVPETQQSEQTHRVRVETLTQGRLADFREFAFQAQNPLQLTVLWERDKYTFAPGSPVELTATLADRTGKEAPAVEFAATLEDPRTPHRWQVPAVSPGRFAGSLPNLGSGEYRLLVTASAQGRVLVTKTLPCYVVDPLQRADFYPLMSVIGISGDGHLLDEPGLRERVDDLLAHGFNTAAITGNRNFTGPQPPTNSVRLSGYSESYAQQRGMATTYEYSSFQMVGRDQKTSPCVFDPAYHAALDQRLAPQIDAGNRTPRLITAKVIDEPVVGPGNMDYCELCQQAFRARYGIDLRPVADYGDDPYARWCFADFLGAYVQEGYSHSAAIMQEHDARFDLLLTYMATGLGYQKPLRTQQDALDWSREVKWADFDVYPYFYPVSQRLRMLQASFAMTSMRDVSRALSIPWGFYVELDDRNWPFQKNPKEASAECAYTAVAHGAGYLNSFINQVTGTGCQSRPERWEEAGKAFRTIRRLGPLLKHLPSAPAPLAILFPDSQQAISDGYPTPDYALQFLRAGFGECDVQHEQVLLESRRIDARGLVLLKTEFLHEDLVPLLQQWLRAGGVLICDQLPSRTHRGKTIDWGFGTNLRSQPDLGPLHWSLEQVGAGRLVILTNDLTAELRALVEANPLNPEPVSAYREALGKLLSSPDTGCGLTSRVRVDYHETPESVDVIEAGLRATDDACLVTVVNHQPQAQTVTLHLSDLPTGWLCDAASMTECQATRSGQDCTLQLEVLGRGARVLTGYRQQPARLSVEVLTPQVRPGAELAYEVTVLDSQGKPLPGGVLVEVEAQSPTGEVVSRYAWPCAPQQGRQAFRMPLALNAPSGRWTLTAVAPQAALRAESAFTVP
jgi:hypothetical protein